MTIQVSGDNSEQPSLKAIVQGNPVAIYRASGIGYESWRGQKLDRFSRHAAEMRSHANIKFAAKCGNDRVFGSSIPTLKKNQGRFMTDCHQFVSITVYDVTDGIDFQLSPGS